MVAVSSFLSIKCRFVDVNIDRGTRPDLDLGKKLAILKTISIVWNIIENFLKEYYKILKQLVGQFMINAYRLTFLASIAYIELDC